MSKSDPPREFVGDCLDVMRSEFADRSVDVIVAIPPAPHELAEAGEPEAAYDYVEWFATRTDEMARVLKLNGTLVVVGVVAPLVHPGLSPMMTLRMVASDHDMHQYATKYAKKYAGKTRAELTEPVPLLTGTWWHADELGCEMEMRGRDGEPINAEVGCRVLGLREGKTRYEEGMFGADGETEGLIEGGIITMLKQIVESVSAPGDVVLVPFEHHLESLMGELRRLGHEPVTIVRSG